MLTFSLKQKDIKKKWYLIDAKEQNLGRVSTKISSLLTGKHKSDYTPSLNHMLLITGTDKKQSKIIVNTNQVSPSLD